MLIQKEMVIIFSILPAVKEQLIVKVHEYKRES